jgi:hypothetical protein
VGRLPNAKQCLADEYAALPPGMRVDHPTIRTLGVLLTCICFLGLTGNLAGVSKQEGCRVTVPIVNNWVRSTATTP